MTAQSQQQEIEALRKRIQELEAERRAWRKLQSPYVIDPDTSLITDSKLYVLTTDANGIIASVSQSYLRLLGNIDREALIHKTSIFDVPLFQSQDAQQQLHAVFDSRAKVSIETRNVLPNSETVFIKHSARPIKDIGDFIGLVMVGEDITHQRDLQERLLEKQAEFRAIFRDLADAVILTDPDRIIKYVNPTALDIFGYSAQELIDQSSRILFASDEEWERVGHIRSEIMQHPERESSAVEITYRRKNGDLFLSQAMGAPLRDDDNRTFGFLGITRDVTEQRKIEQALQQSQQETAASRDALHRLITQLPIGIQVFDQNGTCIDVNQAHLDAFGVPHQDLLINRYNIFAAELARQTGTQEAAQRALAGETVQMGDVEFDFDRFADGAVTKRGKRIINITIFPIFDQHQQVVSIVGLYDDVTEERNAQQAQLDYAVQSERISVLEQLIRDISHDFKTPVTIISTNLYLLRKSSAASQFKYIERIDIQMTRMTKLIEGLITMSRLSQVQNFSFEQVNLVRILTEITSTKSSFAADKGIRLQADLKGERFIVLAEADELVRVFDNLVDNALHYTEMGGQVTIRCQQVKDFAEVKIEDTGIGITQEDIPHIFDRFYRADKARATDTGGTGLGLAIVQRIVELHGGTVMAESTPDVGSVFTVRLPLAT